MKILNTESEFDLTDEDKEELNNLNNEQHEEVEIDVISIDKPVYYSSDDDDDEDSLLYLPVAPDIDEPESDLLPGGEQLTSMKRSSISDLPEINEPSLKKAKVTDVSINGDIYDYKNVKRFRQKPKPKAPNSTRSKRSGKKSNLGKNKKISPMGADIDDEISQHGLEKQAELTT
ncbi:retinoblastoma-binding protein 5-like isoform X2 [Hydra vulgaris]